MEKNNANQTLARAWQLYKSGFGTFFKVAFIAAAFVEYLYVYLINHHINFSSMEDQSADVPTGMFWLSVITLAVMIMVTGFIIARGGSQVKNPEASSSSELNKIATRLLMERLGTFTLVYITSVILLVGASAFLSVVGMWLVTTFTLVLYPAVLVGKQRFIGAYRQSVKWAGSDIWYTFQLALIVVGLWLLDHVLRAILGYGFEAQDDSISFGVQQVIVIFINAVIMPLGLMIAVAAYERFSQKPAEQAVGSATASETQE